MSFADWKRIVWTQIQDYLDLWNQCENLLWRARRLQLCLLTSKYQLVESDIPHRTISFKPWQNGLQSWYYQQNESLSAGLRIPNSIDRDGNI